MSDKEKPTGFDLSKAWDKTKAEYSHGSFSGKLGATASLIGKGLFNTGLSFGKHAVNTVKEATEIAKDYENKDEAFLKSKLESGTTSEKMAAGSQLKKMKEK